MRRRSIHAGFALASVVLAGLAGLALGQFQRLRTAEAPDSPRAMLRQAIELSAADDLESAEPLFETLIRERGDDALGRAALLDLANGYLREGLSPDTEAGRARILTELAKQRYRELLKRRPDDWDARWNLERALREAPEDDGVGWQERVDPIKSVDVVVPDFAPTDLP